MNRAGAVMAVVVLLLVFVLVGLDVRRMSDYRHPIVTDVATPTPMSIASPASASAIPDTDVPGTDLAGLPRYPRATRVGYRRSTTSDLLETRLEYVTADGLPRVHTFYRSTFTANGWFVADTDFSHDERYFFVVQGTREARVHITSDGSSVTISIAHSQLLDDTQATGTPAPAIPTTPQPEATSTPLPADTPVPVPTDTPVPAPTDTPIPTSTAEPPPPPPPPPPPAPPADDDDGDDDNDWNDDDGPDDDDGDGPDDDD